MEAFQIYSKYEQFSMAERSAPLEQFTYLRVCALKGRSLFIFTREPAKRRANSVDKGVPWITRVEVQIILSNHIYEVPVAVGIHPDNSGSIFQILWRIQPGVIASSPRSFFFLKFSIICEDFPRWNVCSTRDHLPAHSVWLLF